jgi:hypothetical protein
VGISSSYHIAKFFGIAAARVSAERTISVETNNIFSQPQHYPAAEPVESEVLDRDGEIPSQEGAIPALPEIGAVINKALRAAGLLRNEDLR